MSSGNFCLAADNLQSSMNEKLSAVEQEKSRLERDKSRLNMQLNKMLHSYKELQEKYEIAEIVKLEDGEGINAKFEDIYKLMQILETKNTGLETKNDQLLGEIKNLTS